MSALHLRPELRDQAQGRWRSILPKLGVPATFLDGKQRPCPVCGGKDRARFDDLDGHGTWFCNQCGAGNGITLAMAMLGMNFADMAAHVRAMLPDALVSKGKAPRDDRRCIAAARSLWMASVPLADTMGEAYLRSRGVWSDALSCGGVLRFIPRCRLPGDEPRYLSALLARVTDVDGTSVNIHRTFLENAQRVSRAMMPGPIPAGSAIRLAEAAPHMGVAEGIETALCAAARFGVSTWATITAGGMERWEPPSGVDRLDIFGDHDRSFTGQAASFALAKRLTNRKSPVSCAVRIPGFSVDDRAIDTDWADAGQMERAA
jgi:putative DNA primase/helicase